MRFAAAKSKGGGNKTVTVYNPVARNDLAKAFKPESDFETRIFHCVFVKILANPLGFAAFCASHSEKFFVDKIRRP